MADFHLAKERALELLKTHDVEQPPVDVRAIAETEGIRVLFKELEDRISGLLVQNGAMASIGVNALHHNNRQRFTLAHELGHYHLHLKGPTAVYLDETMVHFRAEEAHVSSGPEEVEANTFAATLLMPEEFLRRDLQDKQIDAHDEAAVRRIAKRYQVSPQALTIRLMELGLLQGHGSASRR